MRRRRRNPRSGPTLRGAVRAAAGAALVASIVVPALRRRLRARPAVSIATAAAGPLALAVLRPRTHGRDIALYTLQMWAFTAVHEIPYDDPEALRRRLYIRFPIEIDRAIGRGELPNARLQRALANPDAPTRLDQALSLIHWSWFLFPHLSLLYILLRHPEHFPRAARQMAATYDLGCVGYFAIPTAPPWWAAEEGYASENIRRLMVDVGKRTWGRAWPYLYGSLGGNPWAAMPSLHFGSSLMAGLLLAETGRGAGAVGLSYTAALGFALVYLGEHYVTDLLAGGALVGLVRRGEPLAEPLVLAVNRVLQRLERIANA